MKKNKKIAEGNVKVLKFGSFQMLALRQEDKWIVSWGLDRNERRFI